MIRAVIVFVMLAGVAIMSGAQSISFNTPLPWVSLRNDTMVIRAQIDTAAVKNKEVSISLMIAEKGKTKVIATKSFKLVDPSGEFSFGKINKTLVGGESYLKIMWNIKGTEEKGEIEPVGIADLFAIKTVDTIRAISVSNNASNADIAKKTIEKTTKTGGIVYGLAWNKEKLFIVMKKSVSGDTLKLVLDGKCGKNAFLSYPDRVVMASFSDSIVVKGVHFQREVQKNSIVYNEKNWQNEITSEVVGENLVICMPWFDSGIIPFEERTIGAAIFAVNGNNKSSSSFPEKADLFIPATWGILVLHK